MSVSVSLYAAIAKAIAARPRTTRDAAALAGCKTRSARLLIGRMHGMGFIHIAAWDTSPRGPMSACWKLGPSKDAQRPVCANGVIMPPREPRPIRPCRVGVELLHFVTLIRALEHPISVQELRVLTGRQASTLYHALRTLRSLGLAHISEWNRERHVGDFAPLWQFALDKKDAPKPKAFSVQELNRRHRSGRRKREQTLAVLRALASNGSVFNLAA